MSCYPFTRGFAPTLTLALLLAGCGGSSTSTPPPAMTAGEGTAVFRVDVGTGKVTVTPLTGEATKRAVMNGRVITFNSSPLTVENASLGTRALSVQLTNNLNQPIGNEYLRVVLSSLRIEPASGTALRLVNPLTAYGTGDGTEPYIDYPLTAGPLASKTTTAALPWVFLVPAGTQRFSFIATVEAATASPTPPLGAVQVTHPRTHIQTVIVRSLNAPTATASQQDGPARTATLNQRTNGIDVAPDGAVFLSSHRTVRRYDPRTGQITTIAGDPASSGEVNGSGVPGTAARFHDVSSVAVARPDLIYVADTYACRIYLLQLSGANPAAASSWTVSHILGTGTPGTPNGAANSPIRAPLGLAVAGERTLWFVDLVNQINLATSAGGTLSNRANWVVRVVGGAAGTGSTDSPSRFNAPWDLVATSSTEAIVADRANHKLRRITAAGVVTTVAGSATPGFESGYIDGPASTARFAFLGAIARDQAGNLYAADRNGLRRISSSGEVSTIARRQSPPRDGIGASASIGGIDAVYPALGLSVAPDGDIWLVDEAGLRRISRVLTSPTG